jgi:ATP-dependent DNA ligase
LQDVLGNRPQTSLFRFSDHMIGDGNAVLESACKMGLVGIISKRLDRPYRSGRSPGLVEVVVPDVRSLRHHWVHSFEGGK